MSESDLCNLQIALLNCEICNYIRPYEARIFTNYGIPIMQVLANILNEPITGIAEKINNKEMSYQDLICALSVIAQDFKVMEQKNKLLWKKRHCNHFAASTKAKRYARSKMAISKCFGFVKNGGQSKLYPPPMPGVNSLPLF